MASNITEEFRNGLSQGQLLLQKCLDCGKLNMYPRHACPHCQSDNLGWERAEGSGTLHTFTVLRAGPPQGFEAEIPYALAVVKLTEGVQFLARLSPDDQGGWDSYECDDKVVFSAKQTQDEIEKPCPWFARVKPRSTIR
tara:strand:- start:33 stop:449 length:417 start_codon:yes stop_codon:yes gene_type:complete